MSKSKSNDKPHLLKNKAIVIPISVVLGVALGVGVVIVAYKNSETVKTTVDRARESVKNKFSKKSDPVSTDIADIPPEGTSGSTTDGTLGN